MSLIPENLEGKFGETRCRRSSKVSGTHLSSLYVYVLVSFSHLHKQLNAGTFCSLPMVSHVQ